MVVTRKRKYSSRKTKSTSKRRKTSTTKRTRKTTTKKPLTTTLYPKDARRSETIINPHSSSSATLNIASKKIYGGSLTNIDRVSNVAGGLDIDNRLHDKIMVHGFAINLIIKQLKTTHTFINVAVVQTKRSGVIGGLDAGLDLLSNLFLAPGAERGQDFTGTLDPLLMFSYNINPDEYTVIHESRHMIGAVTTEEPNKGSTGLPCMKKVEIYVPMKKEITYPGGSAVAVNPVYLLYWVCGVADTASVAGSVHLQSRATTYWTQK